MQTGNKLTLELCFFDPDDVAYKSNFVPPAATFTSPEYLINCLAIFQAKIIKYQRTLLYFVKFSKKRPNDKLMYTMRYTHNINSTDNVDKSEDCVITDNGRWHLITEYHGNKCTFYVSVVLSTHTVANRCASVYADTELTDVEVRGMDGSVHMHKVIAAACSPVMKTSFTGEWGKEPKSVINAPPDTTKATLQHLKDYMYLSVLPATGLKQLLLLASFYMMPDLELRCVQALLTEVSSEDAYELIEFGMKNQMTQLIFEIMHRVQIGTLDADEIQKHLKWHL